ncbi:uncharacterized protein LOC131230531 [Magnolia sinica]|uniref:uncharacterized protein LOC131230531 n=1 Tax=Magnolia sinica TaxID=86752 RepID=UPI00265AB7B5|nr:uncharacterized protein LOC131230531 [Magnolia sinica]
MSQLVWKTLSKAVPVDAVVQSKGIQLASRCYYCDMSPPSGHPKHNTKTLLHSFMEGDLATAIWQHFAMNMGFHLQRALSVEQRLHQWWACHVIRKEDSISQKLFPCYILWEIWIARNRAKYDGVRPSLHKILSTICWKAKLPVSFFPQVRYRSPSTQTPTSFLNVAVTHGTSQLPSPLGFWNNGQTSLLHISATTEIVKWYRSSPGWVKINVDGLALGNLGLSGGGGICRGDKGNFIFAFTTGYGHGSNVHVELRAFHDGIYCCLSKGLKKVIIESDSLLLINLISGEASPGWKWEAWISRIKTLMALAEVKIAHIFREGNAPTDSLAQMGSANQSFMIFDDIQSLPPRTRGTIFLDELSLGAIRKAHSL